MASLTLSRYLSDDALTAHLESQCFLKVNTLTDLDLNVYLVETGDGTSVVARVFPEEDAPAAITKTAELLGHLSGEEQGFRVESCFPCPVSPVSRLRDRPGCVLLTCFVAGRRPERNKETFYRLGRLHGRLTLLPPPPGAPDGGAWHHIILGGRVGGELAAAMRLLDGVAARRASVVSSGLGPQPEDGWAGRLKEKLEAVRSSISADLPLSLVHPDLVPANIIEHPGDGVGEGGRYAKWTVIDWAGAGVGPRIFALGYTVAVAAARGSLGLVNAVVKGYLSTGANLEPAELGLALWSAIYTRMAVIKCWEIAAGRTSPGKAEEDDTELRRMVDKAAERVREVVSST